MLCINGRYLSQHLTGVQRFATEITAALRRLDPAGVSVVRPHGAWRGHVWEQIVLPRQVAGRRLINLGNTGPLLLRDQLVVIHDVGVVATPDAYAWQIRLGYQLVQRCLIRAGARIATVSAFARDEIVRHLGANAETIAVVGEGADHMDRVAADASVLGTNALGRFVLAVGTLAAHKNLAALGDLAGALHRRAMSLVIVGARPARGFAAAAGLPRPACYLGRVSDAALKALYQAAACLVFPSRYEGFGLPAIEAMACGCPVVAAGIPALRETAGDAALFCDPGTPAEFTRQVLRVLDDAPLAGRLRRAGLARAARFTWDRAARALMAAAA